MRTIATVSRWLIKEPEPEVLLYFISFHMYQLMSAGISLYNDRKQKMLLLSTLSVGFQKNRAR